MTTKIGLVFYADTPGEVFRRVHPALSDREITDELCPCGCGDLHWIGHLDKARNPNLLIVDADSPEASLSLTGTP
jgi:hypothetical protein